MLFRKAYKGIKKWFDSTNKNALLIDGARQIGKTDLIREFLKNNVQSYIEFNLYENDFAKQAFDTINNAKHNYQLKLAPLVQVL